MLLKVSTLPWYFSECHEFDVLASTLTKNGLFVLTSIIDVMVFSECNEFGFFAFL